MFLFCVPFDPVRLSKLNAFKRFIVNHDFDLCEILAKLKALVVDPIDGFTVANLRKRKLNPRDSGIPLSDKFNILADNNNENDDIDASKSNERDIASGSQITIQPKNKMHLFYLEIK